MWNMQSHFNKVKLNNAMVEISTLKQTINSLNNQLALTDNNLIDQCLPNTYYAGLSNEARLVMLVSQWNRAIVVNQELQSQLDATKSLDYKGLL